MNNLKNNIANDAYRNIHLPTRFTWFKKNLESHSVEVGNFASGITIYNIASFRDFSDELKNYAVKFKNIK